MCFIYELYSMYNLYDCCYSTCLFIGDKREVVLDYIIERKRLDDLSSSIVDGRYKEQKVS